MLGLISDDRGQRVSDSFNRADDATSLGSADTGQPWAPLNGTWGISSNKAYLVTTTSQATAATDGGSADANLSVDVTMSPTLNRAATGVIVRATDASNYLMIAMTIIAAGNSITLWKRQGGFTKLQEVLGAGFVNGQTYAVRVVVSGPQVIAYVDGVEKINHTLAGADATAFATPTLHGIRIDATGTADDGNSRFDNFRAVKG